MKSITFLAALTSTTVVSASVFARHHDGEHAAAVTVPTPPTATIPDLGPTASCLASCAVDDVNCRAACVGGASANTEQVNNTYNCITACPQGDGSKAASDAYAVCKEGCINSYYLVSQTPGATPVAAPTSTPSVSAVPTASVSGTAPAESKPTASVSGYSASVSGVRSSTPTISGTTTTRSTPTGTQTPAASTSQPSSDAANGPKLFSAGGLAAVVLAFFAL
ncbi:hypothetical protein QTJ16_000174 [Diplocarpon rosae]|uniref:Uncharacterized protein n=1 Tax=Diplocarpon rosae TaxID=946125 RepID=A0AAD9T608_9HELO|nr:hypothetical protein QTJ16_000174 [Diplocarpon rosae]PBP23342.1 hypothetical protein BUE80_DR005859 [Diplocarpon rosae]